MPYAEYEKALLSNQGMLNLIQSDLCHPEAISLQPGPVLFCHECQKTLFAVYDYINGPHSDHFRSAELAQAYAAWTGDEQVPMSFPVSHCEGIYDTVVKDQPLSRVRKSIRLLRAINAPFTSTLDALPSEEDTSTFLAEFLNILYEHPSAQTTDERMALNALMKCMHDILACKDISNPFNLYYTLLVPYVQECFAKPYQPFHDEPEHPNQARELHVQLIRSHCIRKLFGRYAIPFDVLHVMVACYACSSNMEVVGNWAIDFLVRICRAEFYWKNFAECPLVIAMQRLIASEITYKKNIQWYQTIVKPIQCGESKEHYSHILQPLLEAQAYLKRKWTCLPAGDMLDLAFSHLFPAVLFSDYTDALGFTLGFNHLLMTLNRKNGQLPKGTCKKSKLIHEVVRQFVIRIRKFEDGGSGPTLWNLDMVKLFFASDENFQQEIMQVVRILVEEE